MDKVNEIRLQIKETEKQKRAELQKKATELYSQGYSLRQVGKALKISHEWARKAINGFSTEGDK